MGGDCPLLRKFPLFCFDGTCRTAAQGLNSPLFCGAALFSYRAFYVGNFKKFLRLKNFEKKYGICVLICSCLSRLQIREKNL